MLRTLFTRLFESGLEALKDLKLDLGLGNILLAAAAVGNLLCLGDLVPDGLLPVSVYTSKRSRVSIHRR